MKYLKWLWENHFEKVMAILGAVAFIVGMIVAAIVCAEEDKAREEAVNAYLAQSVVLAAEIDTPIIPKDTRQYFDVPLSEEVQERIFDECEKHSLSPAVVVAMIERESKYDEKAIGDDGRSFGLMQVMAKWHIQRMADLNCENLIDPCQNVTVGIDILAEQMNRYDGDIAKALTAYNRGHYSGTVTEYATSVLEQAKKIEYSVKGE